MATSPNATIADYVIHAQLTGLSMIGTGDILHPYWRAQLAELLEEVAPGTYQCHLPEQVVETIPRLCRRQIRILATTEINLRFRLHDKTYQFHLLMIFPSISHADRLATQLRSRGIDLKSDGRPTVTMAPRDFSVLVRETVPRTLLIPAHIWTPWFGILGARTGYNSLQEGFEDEVHHLAAIETGLSSDAPMNALLSTLDSIPFVAFSDAHSPHSLARNCTEFIEVPPDFSGVERCLRQFPGYALRTFHEYPQLGKYYHDGHRKCDVSCAPSPAAPNRRERCPRCGRPLTIGVLHRVLLLADRTSPNLANRRWEYTLPLPKLVAIATHKGEKTKCVGNLCTRLRQLFGPDLLLLREVPAGYLRDAGYPQIAEVLTAFRERRLQITPGFDGRFGVLKMPDSTRKGA